jgi:rare lipoprotein A
MLNKFYLLAVFTFASLFSVNAQNNYTENGQASYYGDEFNGNKTASGEIYNMNDYTAAHRTLPFGTKVKVTNLKNNKTVIVRINDRGPFKSGRIIDLSKAAAKQIDLIKYGVVDVKIETNLDNDEPPIIPDDKIVLNKGYYAENLKKVKPKGYGVQVGAYKQKENALKNLKEISKKYNKPVYLYVTSNLNFKKYKIYIGEVKNKKLAEPIKLELKKGDFPDCFIKKY